MLHNKLKRVRKQKRSSNSPPAHTVEEMPKYNENNGNVWHSNLFASHHILLWQDVEHSLLPDTFQKEPTAPPRLRVIGLFIGQNFVFSMMLGLLTPQLFGNLLAILVDTIFEFNLHDTLGVFFLPYSHFFLLQEVVA